MSKKEYFIENKSNKQGAFTLDELIKLDIYDDTLVWKAGWADWKKATEVEELEAYVILKPPPTKREKVQIVHKEKINKTLSKAPSKFLKIIGIALGMVILTALFGTMGNMNDSYGLGIFGYLIIGVLGWGIYLIVKIVKE
jgi:hypothetical protein